MSQSEPDPETPLQPCTVPSTCQLSFRGLGDDAEWNGRFQEAVRQLVIGCGRCMDLALLDGVTVGVDYDDALASVELGYESSIAKQYTNADGLIGVGKMLRVKREGQIEVHVVINANAICALADQEHEMFWPCANIVAHELAHVAVVGWFEAHSPGIMLSPRQGDWAVATLREAAHAIWEEYAACRLSAKFNQGNVVRDNYAQGLETASEGAIASARDSIKAYRSHGDVSQLLVEACRPIANALKMASYLMGHLDGSDNEFEISTQCPIASGSEFAPVLPDLLDALREAWDKRLDWNGLEGVDGIVDVIVAALATAGAKVTLCNAAPGSRVDVPRTAETMPNGEADMVIVRMRESLGLG
ncbi:MAG: hypothetical protein ACTS5I_02975 [Rhodanobacter sp.]